MKRIPAKLLAFRSPAPGTRALSGVVAMVCSAVSLAGGPLPSLAQATGGPRSYEAPRAASAPVIDGALGDPAWRDAPWTEPFVDIRGEDWPDPAWTTRAKITWDECCLYVAAELEEPHLWATLTGRDAIIYRDHDFEVFLDPDGDGLEYYELEINALGTEFDLFLDKPYRHGGKAHIGWDMAGLRTGTPTRAGPVRRMPGVGRRAPRPAPATSGA